MKIKSVILNNILESIPEGLLVINPDGEIVTSNQAASVILGYACSAFEGKGWGDLFLEDLRNQDFNQVLLDVIQEKKEHLHRRVHYFHPRGDRLELSITGSFLKENGEIAGIVLILHDVTELTRLHEREKRILEERHRFERERAKGLAHLSLAISHQIRNPVMSIGGFAVRALGKLPENSPLTPYLKNIVQDAERLESIVKAVHDVAQISSAEPVWVSPGEILEAQKLRLVEKAAFLQKTFSCAMEIEDIEFKLDPRLFSRAVFEVLLNALEFFKGNEGDIRMRLSKESEGLFLEISDNGIGIAESDIPFVFDPFFTTKAVGVGMGLCRVKRIVNEHGGEVRVQSQRGEGARVVIRIPEPSEE